MEGDGRSILSMSMFAPAIRSRLSLALLILVAILAGRVFAIDWCGPHPWMASWLAIGTWINVVAWLPLSVALVFSAVFGWVAIHSSFYWAEQMLAYSLDQQGWLPRLVFGGLVAMETLPFMILSGCLVVCRRRGATSIGLAVPFAVWIVLESWWPRVFGWTLGHAQQGFPRMVQIADLGGASLISWLLLWGCGLPLLAADGWGGTAATVERSRASRRGFLAVLGGLAISLGYGEWQLAGWSQAVDGGGEFRVGAVQVDPSYVDSVARMRAVSDRLAASHLLAWPESTLGVLGAHLTSLADEEAYRQASLLPFVPAAPLLSLPVPVVLGGRSMAEAERQSQTAFVVLPGGEIHARYHKRRLMPLGEYVPGEERWPWLHDFFQLNEFLIPGNDDAPIVLPDQTRLGMLVCFEDIIPSVSRASVAAGAELLLCIINASAFENPLALQQHRLLAQLRAIENRRYLVRVAGTGVSCCINPVGAIEEQLPPMVDDAFVARTRRIGYRTLYSFTGDWVAWTAILLLLAAWGRTFVRRRARSGRCPPRVPFPSRSESSPTAPGSR
jgi:apolipoprotein N-acyltransferase